MPNTKDKILKTESPGKVIPMTVTGNDGTTEVVGQQNVPELKVDGTLNDTQLKKWQKLNAPNPDEDETEMTLRDYMNSINAPSAKDEEAERKKARSRAIIGGVSDMAVAVSNIINANKGGVSMPQSNLAGMYAGKWAERKKDIQGLRDKKFQAGMALATLKDKRKAQKAQNELAKQQLGIDLTKLQLEIRKAEKEGRLKDAQALKAAYEANKAQIEAMNEAKYGEKQREADIKAKNASAASSYASAASSNANARKTNQEADIEAKNQKMKIGLGNGETVELDANAFNDVEVGRLFGMLPPEVRAEYGQTVTTGLASEKAVSKNPTRAQMLAAIGANVGKDGDEYNKLRTELRRMAGVRAPLPAGNYVEKKDNDYFQQYLKTGATDFSIYKEKK